MLADQLRGLLHHRIARGHVAFEKRQARQGCGAQVIFFPAVVPHAVLWVLVSPKKNDAPVNSPLNVGRPIRARRLLPRRLLPKRRQSHQHRYQASPISWPNPTWRKHDSPPQLKIMHPAGLGQKIPLSITKERPTGVTRGPVQVCTNPYRQASELAEGGPPASRAEGGSHRWNTEKHG